MKRRTRVAAGCVCRSIEGKLAAMTCCVGLCARAKNVAVIYLQLFVKIHPSFDYIIINNSPAARSTMQTKNTTKAVDKGPNK